MKSIFQFITIASLSVLVSPQLMAAGISQNQSQDENYRTMHQRHHGSAMQGHHGGAMQNHHGGAMQNHHGSAMQGHHGGAMQNHHGGAMQNHHGGMMQNHHANSMGHQHDEATMPGLQGKDTTEDEVDDLAKIFREHKGISRQVVNLPNGIKTLTKAEDESLRDAVVNHVSMMVTRLEEGKNPEVMIQSPTLDKLFAVYGEIETEIELTETGVAVIQTSDNPEVVRLLQTHAAEVSDMAMRGMLAVHERMSKSH